MPQIQRFARALAQPFEATPATLAKLYLAFWSGQFCLALFACHYAGTFRNPTATAAFDVGSLMVVGALGMALGYMLPSDDGPSVRLAVAVVAGAAAVGLVRILVAEALAPHVGWTPRGLAWQLIMGVMSNLFINTSFVGLGSGIASVVRNAHEQARLASVDRELSDSRIAAVRAHLRPDFILEAMASIADQIDLDPDAAAGRLTALTALMSLQLRRAGVKHVSVEEEIEFVRAYLELARTGPGARIHLHVSVEDEVRRLPIPPNCLSILLEAVLRARPASVEEVSVRIEVAVQDSLLDVRLSDDLPVAVTSRGLGEWEAVRDLSAGLRGQFGPSAVPVFHPREVGALARVSIPLERPAEARCAEGPDA